MGIHEKMRMRDESKHPHKEVGKRLLLIRQALFPDMTRTEYAAMCGFNYTQYSNWESGHRRIMPEDAIKLCDKFGVDLDFIYRGTESQLPTNLVKAFSSKP